MSWPLSPRRRPDPAKVLLRGALLLCGFAFTWTCAASGLFLLGGPGRVCRLPLPSHVADARIAELRHGISLFQIDRNRCPTSIDELIAGDYVNPRDLVDPWGTIVDEKPEGDGLVRATLDGDVVNTRRTQMPCLDHAVLWR